MMTDADNNQSQTVFTHSHWNAELESKHAEMLFHQCYLLGLLNALPEWPQIPAGKGSIFLSGCVQVRSSFEYTRNTIASLTKRITLSISVENAQRLRECLQVTGRVLNNLETAISQLHEYYAVSNPGDLTVNLQKTLCQLSCEIFKLINNCYALSVIPSATMPPLNSQGSGSMVLTNSLACDVVLAKKSFTAKKN
jgi:hypothetical protein